MKITHGIRRIALCIDMQSADMQQRIITLLTVTCLTPEGHRLVVDGMSHYKSVKKEKHRFETLVKYLSTATTLDAKVTCTSKMFYFIHF
jgi:hypothetical protein